MSDSSDESFQIAHANTPNSSNKRTVTNGYISCHPESMFTIRTDPTGPGSEPPITIPVRFAQVASAYPNLKAFYFQEPVHYQDQGDQRQQANADMDGSYTWKSTTYQQYYDMVRKTARSFIVIGLKPDHAVGIMGFNAPEWFYSNLGAIFAGGLSTGIYTTSSPEACHHILSDSRANIVVVEDGAQLAKILKIKDRLPLLRAAVQYKGQLQGPKIEPGSGFRTYSWNEFLGFANDVPDSELEDRLSNVVPHKCSTLIYTSGTTGTPKGVMISHDNLTWTARQTESMVDVKNHETLLSYLPLSHVAAQIVDIYLVINTASTIWFAHPDALKGTLVINLKDVRPTIFIGVPRVWEKISEKMQEVGRNVHGIKKNIATWAKRTGTEGTGAIMRGKSTPWGWSLANMLVFKKIRKALGLDQTRYFVSTGAPLAKETLFYFNSINIPIMEVFGMSECSGPASLNFHGTGKHWAGSVGLPLHGTQIKIDNENESGVGEICIKGRHVFMGYLNKEKETKEVLDSEGWLRSGDLGRLEYTSTGGPFLYVTGRIKELIITAGGENIAPVPIEDALKNELKDIVSNAMVVGDYKKFLSVLLTLKCEMDKSSGMPLDELTPLAQSWVSSYGSDVTSVQQILNQKPVNLYQAIQTGINRVNELSVSRAALIRKWAILPNDFSVPGGELGPTLKLRRPIVLKMYAQIVDDLYNDDIDKQSNVQGNQYLKPDSNGQNIPLKHSESYITHI